MISLADTLAPEHVALALPATTPEAAVAQLAGLLRHDERVLDWPAFYAELREHLPCRVLEQEDFGICVPHARTSAVSEMVMSAGRFDPGITFSACDKPVRYLFCIGVPQAMASDYLRIAGALMRIFTDPEAEAALHAAATREEFVAVLTRLERKL